MLIWLYATGHVTLWFLLVFSVANGVVRAVANPASRRAMAALLPRDLVGSGISNRQIGQEALSIGAPPVAGALAPVIGIGGVLTIDAVSFLVSLLLVWTGVPADVTEPAPRSRLLDELGEGLRYLIRKPWLRDSILLTTMTNWLFAGAVSLALPVLAASELAGVQGYGILVGAQAGGSLLAGVVVARTGTTFTVFGYAVLTATQGVIVVALAVSALLPAAVAVAAAGVTMFVFGFSILWVGVWPASPSATW